MKIKKILLLFAPAMLLASCNPNKATTTISKINLSNAKTLVMGKLSNSSVTTNDDEEQLISVDEEGNATETEVEVTTGNKTTETTNITISRLVKLNKEYAVVSCTYNDVTYDLIVNLTDGTCVKFPDSSLLPNSKEKMGGRKEYRRYKKQYGYLNNMVVQPNSEEKFFYYINCYQIDETSNKYARRLVMLDLENDPNKPSATVLVTPVDDDGNKLSVQSFAVNNNGAVAYVASKDIKIENPEEDLLDPKIHYNGEDCLITTESSYTISPVLITGEDGVIYCYLKNNYGKYITGKIEFNEDKNEWKASPVDNSNVYDSYPEKVFGIDGTDGTKLVTIGKKTTETFNQIFTFSKRNDYTFNSFSGREPGGKDNPSGRKEENGQKGISINPSSSGGFSFDSIIDGFSGNGYGYLFGTKDSKKYLRKVECTKNEGNDSYTYLEGVLTTYLENLSDDAAIEIESDDDSEDITVVVADGEEETVYVVSDDTENAVEEITEVSDVVDVAA